MTTAQTLNLTKGEKVDLTKGNPGLQKLNVGLGWDTNAGTGAAYDLDAFALLLNDQMKVVGPSLNESVVYFNNKVLPGVKTLGDNLTGQGDGDDETIEIELSAVKPEVHNIVICVNIFEAQSRGQNFGKVRNAFIRVYNAATGGEDKKYDLSEDFGTATGVVMGRVYRHNGEWKFEAIGDPHSGDINSFVAKYS